MFLFAGDSAADDDEDVDGNDEIQGFRFAKLRYRQAFVLSPSITICFKWFVVIILYFFLLHGWFKLLITNVNLSRQIWQF